MPRLFAMLHHKFLTPWPATFIMVRPSSGTKMNIVRISKAPVLKYRALRANTTDPRTKAGDKPTQQAETAAQLYNGPALSLE